MLALGQAIVPYHCARLKLMGYTYPGDYLSPVYWNSLGTPYKY